MSREWAPSHSRLIGDLSAVEAELGDAGPCLAIIKDELGRLGLGTSEPSIGAIATSRPGNVEVSIVGADVGRRVLICAPLEVSGREGVAALLTAAGVWADTRPAVSVDLAFTVVQGSGPLAKPSVATAGEDVSVAFVLADSGQLGTVVMDSPFQQTVRIQFSGGPRGDLEAAMKGLLTETKPAVSLVDGPTAVLLVSQPGSRELAERIATLTDVCQNQAQQYGCAVDLRLTPRFRGYQHSDDHPAAALWGICCAALGIDLLDRVTDQGSAANALEAQGVSAVNVGTGTGANDAASVDTSGNSQHLVELLLELPGLVPSP